MAHVLHIALQRTFGTILAYWFVKHIKKKTDWLVEWLYINSNFTIIFTHLLIIAFNNNLSKFQDYASYRCAYKTVRKSCRSWLGSLWLLEEHLSPLLLQCRVLWLLWMRLIRRILFVKNLDELNLPHFHRELGCSWTVSKLCNDLHITQKIFFSTFSL